MADKIQNVEKLKIGEQTFNMSVWEQLGISKLYFLSLLSRDEYCPVADKKPTETTTTYIDPASGNPAGFHAGQCVVYPDPELSDGWGLSIAKKVDSDNQGNPQKIYWLHFSDIEKKINTLGKNSSTVTRIDVSEVYDGKRMRMVFKPKVEDSTDLKTEDGEVILLRNFLSSDEEDAPQIPDGIYFYVLNGGDDINEPVETIYKSWVGSENYRPNNSFPYHQGALYQGPDNTFYYGTANGFQMLVEPDYTEILEMVQPLQEKVASMPSCVLMEGRTSGKLGQPGPISMYFKDNPDFDLDKVVAGEQQVFVHISDSANHEVTVRLDVLRTKQSDVTIYNVGFNIGVYSYMQMSGVTSTNDLYAAKTYQCCIAMSAAESTKLTELPSITSAMKTDNKVYALVNGNYDDIAPEGYDVVYKTPPTAESIALKALQTEFLDLNGVDEEMVMEIMNILGEKRFNEMAANMSQTQLTMEQRLEMAKAEYDARMAERLGNADSIDVEPKIEKKI